MSETAIKRVLPHNKEAETSVIGAMLINPSCIREVSDVVRGEDFYDSTLGMFFECIMDLDSAAIPVDAVTLSNKIAEKTQTENSEELQKKLMEIAYNTPTSANVSHHAKIVSEKATLRRLIAASNEISERCYKDADPVTEILDSGEKAIFNIAQNRQMKDVRRTSEIFMNAMMNIEKASETRGLVTGIPSGFTQLDYMTAGFQPSDLILIAARPSMGKTALALNIIEHAVLKSDVTTAMFSLEMSCEQLANRLLSMHSKVESQRMRTGNIDDKDWAALITSTNMFGSSKLLMDDTPGITIAQLRSKCRRWKVEKNLQLVIIDYLQLMEAGHKTESRQQEISEISRSLKALAREIQCPVIALSQLSRGLESRTDKRPMLSDLRESGAIEQDADVVMFIYRDVVYNKDTADQNVAEIIIGKQRNGPIGTVKLGAQLECTRFYNIEQDARKEE